MSAAFFAELGLPDPAHHLGVGSGTHGVQAGEMLKGLDGVLSAERPALILVYGDTNSTLGGRARRRAGASDREIILPRRDH